MKSLISALITAMITAMVLSSVNAMAGAREFIPKIVNYTGFIEISGLYKEDENRTKNKNSSNSYKTDELTIQEILNVGAQGYIYSPLFISFNTLLGGGLQQKDINVNDDSYRSDDDLYKYKIELKVLPSHPYHLDLYALRETPLSEGRAVDSGSVVITEYGARAEYLLRPWKAMASYINNRYEGSSTYDDSGISEYDFYQLDFSYFQDDVNASAGYNRNDSDGNHSTTTRELYYIDLTKQFAHLEISGRWDEDEQEQRYDADRNENDSDYLRKTWYAEMRAELPSNFTSTLIYRKNDNRNEYRIHDSKTVSSNKNENYNLMVHHRLFKSLTSSVNLGYTTNDSNGGESKQKRVQGISNYVKKIPWGEYFFGIHGGRSDFDNTGALSNLFERHAITNTGTGENPPYTFTLNYQNVDENSILISLIDHNNNNRLIRLEEGINYLPPIPYNNTFRIRIISLPPGVAAPIGFIEDYMYQADYSFIPADYELRTDNWGCSTSIAFFDNLITPHYDYNWIDQDVIDGIYPGEPDSSTNHALGLSFDYFPFRGDITQNRYRGDTRDEDRLTAYLNYIQYFTSHTEGRLTLNYEDIDSTDYSYGIAAPSLSEQLYSAQAQILTNLPEKNLTASLNGVYSFYDGEGETTTWSLFSSLHWYIGRMDFSLTGTYSSSESKTGSNKNESEYTTIRFKITRELF